MRLADFVQRMRRFQKNAEVIFDAEEPIGRPTDLVMPPPRRRRKRKAIADAAQRAAEKAL